MSATGRNRTARPPYVFKGTFNLADSSVSVRQGQPHVRRAGLVGQRSPSTSPAPASRVADVNGDGERNAADLQEGDIVVVKARLPRREPGAAPFAARKLVDQSHGREHTREPRRGSTATALQPRPQPRVITL